MTFRRLPGHIITSSHHHSISPLPGAVSGVEPRLLRHNLPEAALEGRGRNPLLHARRAAHAGARLHQLRHGLRLKATHDRGGIVAETTDGAEPELPLVRRTITEERLGDRLRM